MKQREWGGGRERFYASMSTVSPTVNNYCNKFTSIVGKINLLILVRSPIAAYLISTKKLKTLRCS